MNKFTIILPFAFASQFALAQTDVPIGLDAERNLAAIGDSKTGTMIRTYDNRYEGVKGTPYFLENWSKATITNNNTLYHNVELKYNVHENKLFYRSAGKTEFILDPSKVDSFVLTENETKQEYLFKQLPALAAQDLKLHTRFVLIIFEGEQLQLAMVPEKTLIKADFKGGYSAGKKYDELVDVQTYYLIGLENQVKKVKLNKKSLLKALPDKQDKMQEFFSSTNPDLATAEGWSKSLAYYESLLK